jgi:hypothetical protein
MMRVIHFRITGLAIILVAVVCTIAATAQAPSPAPHSPVDVALAVTGAVDRPRRRKIVYEASEQNLGFATGDSGFLAAHSLPVFG